MTAFLCDNNCEKSKHNKIKHLKTQSIISVIKTDILSYGEKLWLKA